MVTALTADDQPAASRAELDSSTAPTIAPPDANAACVGVAAAAAAPSAVAPCFMDAGVNGAAVVLATGVTSAPPLVGVNDCSSGAVTAAHSVCATPPVGGCAGGPSSSVVALYMAWSFRPNAATNSSHSVNFWQ